MKLKKKSSLYPLVFGLVWVVLALLTHSWEPALIGGFCILITAFLIIHDIKTAKEKSQSEKTIIEKTEFPVSDEKNKKVEFREFGFWIESLSQINTLLCYMQRAVEIAVAQGFSIGEVNTFGGVHELDTGYEVFPSRKYNSFEEAKEKLPVDFAKEEAKLDGLWLNTINFEFFTVNVSKDGETSKISFSRGEINATDELYEIYLNTEWNRN